MIESILFKNQTFMSPDGLKTGDILVKNGRIDKIEPNLPEHAELIIKDKGLVLLPGAIDPHVHFREPGGTHKETIETGSRAAASGGVTSFFEMPNTSPPTTSRQAIADKKQKAKETSLVNYNFFIGATPDNLEELVKVEDVPGIKLYIGSTTGNLVVESKSHIETLFQHSNKLIAVHAEDDAIIRKNKEAYADSTNPADHPKIRSAEAAISATRFAVGLAQKYKKRLHICHMTTADEAQFLSGLQDALITCEVSPQHLLLEAPHCYEKWGTFAQMNPPIRTKDHQDALWKGLFEGTVTCIATDHAPHTIEEKQQPFGKAPSGLPGIETALPLMLTQVNAGRLSLQQLVFWMCEGPARCFNIKKKGRIQEGYDADFVLVDMNASYTLSRSDIHSKCGWSIFEDWPLKGKPISTFVNGQLVYRESDFFTSIKGREIQFN